MANLDKGKPSRKLSQDDKDKAAVAAGVAGCGCIGALVLAKLAAVALVLFLAYELVSWVITK